ncbi:MAG: membrane-associated protein [Candidatus Peregrinibacteria bacterium Greene0416_19]|nr:MAG: membrane-associated protein [Candidatus Peregrinibacteria bacterium Greene0416_19]
MFALFLEFLLHLDVHLDLIIQHYGALTYAILFLVILCETGLVVTPFLPGDSLLFAAGAFAARGSLDPLILFTLLSAAAVIGDTLNYAIGHFLGPRVFRMKIPFLNHEHLMRTEEFYERHGGKTIVLARFIPIIRTLAPFVAGVGSMKYGRFIGYNVIGGIVWVALFVFGGYFFGNIPWVKENFTLVILAIIVLSLVPGAYHYAMHRWKKYCALKVP